MNLSQSSVITLKELSQLSGFSISTVSKALNNKFDISLKTREVIQQIANEHNYVPNTYAIGLRKRKTQTIAVIIPQINDAFYSCFLHNIEKIASKLEYRILLFQSFEKNSKEKEYLQKIYDGSVDGVIILSTNTIHTTVDGDRTKLPIEFIKISKEYKEEEELKKSCILGFHKLLNRIR
ncbi:MAG: LacI family DNA-binding transcriptional regulator [Kordia sp.]|uniref:LacI family DNA-binding transcriptional regulator n=1 Tax=Kordia sp. TaxID=1965332 RepID=UPI003859D297